MTRVLMAKIVDDVDKNRIHYFSSKVQLFIQYLMMYLRMRRKMSFK